MESLKRSLFPSVQLRPLGSAALAASSSPTVVISEGKETLISAQRGLPAAQSGPRVRIWRHVCKKREKKPTHMRDYSKKPSPAR